MDKKNDSFEQQRVVDIDSEDAFSTSQQPHAHARLPPIDIWEDIDGIIHNPGIEEAKKSGRVYVSPEDDKPAFPPFASEPPCTCQLEPWTKQQALFFLDSSDDELGYLKHKGAKRGWRKRRGKKGKDGPLADDVTFALHKYVGGHFAARAAIDDLYMKYPNRHRNRRRDDAINAEVELLLMQQGEKLIRHNCPCSFMERFRGHYKVWTLFWLAIAYIFIWAFIWVHDVNGFPERARLKELERLRDAEASRTSVTGGPTSLGNTLTIVGATPTL
ncbi:hypothetical protein ABW21_db0200281 [Orbilia brochopaga]|nr:hypothetical protein ABW21_db0200281 [Drechslerella brochopaga]